jgi:hypothetical protein
MADGVETVLQVLDEAGFERLPKPLVVGGSTFDFDAAARGTGVSHDLVVVATRQQQRRLVRLMAGLSRTLDQLDSKRPVSLVLLDGHRDGASTEDLERHARVLTINSANPNADQVRQAVAVLLPLTLPSPTSRGREPLEEVSRILGSSATEEHQLLLDAATTGPDAVREALRRFVDGASGDADDTGSTS